MDYLSEYADRLIALDEGMMVEDGSPEDFLSSLRVFGENALERPPELYLLFQKLVQMDMRVEIPFFATPEDGSKSLEQLLNNIQVSGDMVDGYH